MLLEKQPADRQTLRGFFNLLNLAIWGRFFTLKSEHNIQCTLTYL